LKPSQSHIGAIHMIPEAYLDLLEEPVVVTFVTMMPDGQPQATPVWCKWDGEHIIVNTALGRRKHTNAAANPKVTICAVDPQNPYRYLEVRGTVTEIILDKEDTINELAMQYRGKASYFGPDGVVKERGDERRVELVITPQETSQMGS
ncbi:MAG: PPOX class F420-dependent oxidoreductase, partial [Chloroflexota bacterium]